MSSPLAARARLGVVAVVVLAVLALVVTLIVVLSNSEITARCTLR